MLHVRNIEGRIGNDRQIGKCAPVAGIFPGQYHETVETANDAFILPGAEAVGQSQQPATIVLQAEILVEMQFQHFLASILDLRDKRGLRRIERHHNVGFFFHQQSRQPLPVHTTLVEVRQDLGHGVSAIVGLVVHVQIHHPHFRREGIERRTAVLVGGHDHQLTVATGHPPAQLVEQDPLHAARIVDIRYAIDQFHVSTSASSGTSSSSSLSAAIQKSRASR